MEFPGCQTCFPAQNPQGERELCRREAGLGKERKTGVWSQKVTVTLMLYLSSCDPACREPLGASVFSSAQWE